MPLAFLAGASAFHAVPAAAGEHPAIAAADGDELVPGFEWGVHTYAARCGGDGLSVAVDGARGWKVDAGPGAPRGGDFDVHLDLAGGDGSRIDFAKRNGPVEKTYVRCLPEDMYDLDFQRLREGGPRLYVIQIPPNYMAAVTRAGAPVWWLPTADLGFDAKIFPDGTIGWNGGGQNGVVDYGIFHYASLTGRSIRSVTTASGDFVDVHDHLVLPNGNELVGAPTFREGVDLTAYGGSASARVRDTAIEELTPDGDLVRSWDSGDHIGLDQTPARWWPVIVARNPNPYDVSHWNAVDVVGRYMYLSFRHLDAVYKVDRRTGKIIWKLGGVETNKSLEVRGDPRGDDPLNGQHDVNVRRDGTITLFDNSTITGEAPRAVQYRIDERKGVARMISEVTDPEVTISAAGGSAHFALLGRSFGSLPTTIRIA